VLDNDVLTSSVSAIDTVNGTLSPRQHRSATTAASDFMHEHFTWNTDPGRGMKLRPRLKSEYEIINDAELDDAVREIRKFAEEKLERVPGKKEARAMVRLTWSGKVAVRMYVIHACFQVADGDRIRSYEQIVSGGGV